MSTMAEARKIADEYGAVITDEGLAAALGMCEQSSIGGLLIAYGQAATYRMGETGWAEQRVVQRLILDEAARRDREADAR